MLLLMKKYFSGSQGVVSNIHAMADLGTLLKKALDDAGNARAKPSSQPGKVLPTPELPAGITARSTSFPASRNGDSRGHAPAWAA